MRDALKGYLTLAVGITEVTRQRATAAAKAMVAQGEATAEQVGQLVDDLLAQSRQNREAVAGLVSQEVDRALSRLRPGSDEELAALAERVRALEDEVRELRAAAAPADRAAQGKKGASTTEAREEPSTRSAGTTSRGKRTAGPRTSGKKTPATSSAAAAAPGAAARTATGSES